MAIHDFDANYTVKEGKWATPPTQLPLGLSEMPAVRQLSHIEGGRNTLDIDFLSYPNHLEEFLIPGFRSLDETMKQYWSGVRVPTKDSYRFMRVKVAGGDKSLLVWADELKEGRVRLPVAAISREGHEFNPEKFSPMYHAMGVRYLSTRYDLAAKFYRPVPFLVDYNLIIWAEHKRDAEYILYQALTRFNPLAQFRMFDGKLAGEVQLRFGGSTDASDKEIGFDQQAQVRYEINMTAEAWLPLPEQIVKTVLGTTAVFKERLGQILLASKSATGSMWYEPIQTGD